MADEQSTTDTSTTTTASPATPAAPALSLADAARAAVEAHDAAAQRHRIYDDAATALEAARTERGAAQRKLSDAISALDLALGDEK